MGKNKKGGTPLITKEPPRIPPPKSIKEVPAYLREIVFGFFSRLAYIFTIVWKTGPWILICLVLTCILEGVIPIISSLLSRDIMNELQLIITDQVAAEVSGKAYVAVFWGSAVMMLLVFFFIYKILNQLVIRLGIAVTRIAGEKVTRYVRIQIMTKTKEIDLSSFDLPEFYEKLENANREAGTRPIHVLSSTFDSISTIITLSSYIVILATAPGMWWTALVMLVVSFPSAIINFTYRKKHFIYMRRRSKERRKMNYYSDLTVNKDMAKEIRLYNLSDEFIKRYDDVFDVYYGGMRKLIVKESVWHIATSLISSVISCVFFAIIAFKVFEGELQIGDYSLYTGALTSIASNVTSLISISAAVYEGTLFIDNLIGFMKVEPTIVPSKEVPEKVDRSAPHTIEFVNVSFSYPGSDTKVLDNINLTIRPAETMVLVGLNGAGKTTLLKLLTRLYDTTEGEILLDGKNIKEYDVTDLYRTFGIIFQDFGKYAVSVSENIAFGDYSDTPDPERVRLAATQANADAYISSLPDGYDTSLMKYFEPDGTELSIGQWQKLSIARAFYSDADILILDEPTASLDPIAEQEIFNQFDKLREGKTTIFVSHRLSSATIASKIVVLENGKLVEEGDHKELMRKKGRYYELFSTQAKRYIKEEDI